MEEKRESGAIRWIHTCIRGENILRQAAYIHGTYMSPRNTEEDIYMKYTEQIVDKNGESQ